VPIKPTSIGKIMGKGGETIRGIQNQSGVSRIQIDKDNWVCQIKGPTQQSVDMAAAMVGAIVNDSPGAYYGASSAPGAMGQGGGHPMMAAQPMYGQMPQYAGYPQYGQQAYPQYGAQMAQAPQAAAPAAAGGSQWSLQLDPTSGKNYYWNASTGQSSWEAPPEGL